MSSAASLTSVTAPAASSSSSPERLLIYPTLRGPNKIFQVRCEATGTWLYNLWNPLGFIGTTQQQMREALKKAECAFHKAREDGEVLWISIPIGFWLEDGRLVSPEYKEGKRVDAYFGDKTEIEGRRRMRYI